MPKETFDKKILFYYLSMAVIVCALVFLFWFLFRPAPGHDLLSTPEGRQELEKMTGLTFPVGAKGKFTAGSKTIPLAFVGPDDRLFVAGVETTRETVEETLVMSGLPPLEPLKYNEIVCGNEDRGIMDWWFPMEVEELTEREYSSERISGYYIVVIAGRNQKGDYLMYVVRTNK